MTGILGTIGATVAKPFIDLIDKTVIDKDAREQLKAQAESLAMAYQQAVLEAQRSIIVQEAQGNFLQRSWRPAMMIFFAGMLGAYWLGLAPDYLIENPAAVNDLFDLLKLGIGGYIIGRSGEKVASTWLATRNNGASNNERQ